MSTPFQRPMIYNHIVSKIKVFVRVNQGVFTALRVVRILLENLRNNLFNAWLQMQKLPFVPRRPVCGSLSPPGERGCSHGQHPSEPVWHFRTFAISLNGALLYVSFSLIQEIHSLAVSELLYIFLGTFNMSYSNFVRLQLNLALLFNVWWSRWLRQMYLQNLPRLRLNQNTAPFNQRPTWGNGRMYTRSRQ